MKKQLISFVCGLLLAVSASQANAAVLEDWTYSFDISLSAIASEFVYDQGNDSVSWLSGNKLSTLSVQPTSALDAFANTLEFIGTITSGNQVRDTSASLFLGQTVTQSDVVNTSTAPMELADLTINYIVTAPNGQKLNVTYTVPLWSFYDASNDASYVYYSNFSISTSGPSMMYYEGVPTSVTGVGMYFNDEGLDFVYRDNDVFSSWKFSITEETPAPTPEPATMLLTGLGLAGLGYVKRRRNKA